MQPPKITAKIDMVHNHELYIATISIRLLNLERLHSGFGLTQRNEALKNDVNNVMMSVSVFVIERFVNKQTDEKR